MADNEFKSLLSGSESDEQHIERLIKLGGRREDIDPACRERVRLQVRQAWLEQLERREQKPGQYWPLKLSSRKMPSRKMPSRKMAVSLVASIVIGCLVFFTIGEYSGQRAPELVATVENIDGRATSQGTELPANAHIHPGEMLETGGTDRVALTLADGGVLKLDRQTRLHFLKRGELRLITGAVYFDSKQRSNIRIHTPHGVASDIGTRFETRFQQNQLVVRVRDGQVKVQQPGSTVLVDSGRALQLSDSTAVFSDISPDDEHWVWADSIDKQFSFDGRSMADVLAWLCQRENWRLEYGGETDRKRAREDILHGRLDIENTVELLRQLTLISDMRYRLEGGTLSVNYP